jgi:GT2 family glycosyltransferase
MTPPSSVRSARVPAAAPSPGAARWASPDLSVIIVSWNTSDELRACLESVAAGSRGFSVEVVVVDNASTDGSPDMVEARFPDVRLVRNADNLGFAAGCNAGLRVATGRYLLLLNPDTIVLGDVLAATVRYLNDHPDVGALGCRVLNADRSLQLSCFRDPSVLNASLSVSGLARLPWPRGLAREWMRYWHRDSERDVDVVTGCYLATRRDVVDDVGPLDEGYFFCGEEADWCRRMREKGWIARFAPIGDIVHLDGIAGRQLSERRDLLCMAGQVRFVDHHDGPLAGWAMTVLHWIHAVSRTAAFGTLACVRRSKEGRRTARARRDHQVRITRRFREVRELAGLRRTRLQVEAAASATKTGT